MILFVDTSAFVALEDKDDENYPAAVEYRERVAEGKTPFRLLYTSNYILNETLTLLRAHLGHSIAVSFGTTARTSGILKALWVTPEVDSHAWEVFKRYKDKEFGYTDCTSFCLMEKYAIRTAFTFDKHFNQYGLQQVP